MADNLAFRLIFGPPRDVADPVSGWRWFVAYWLYESSLLAIGVGVGRLCGSWRLSPATRTVFVALRVRRARAVRRHVTRTRGVSASWASVPASAIVTAAGVPHTVKATDRP